MMSKREAASIRVTVDLLHIAAGRPDLSSNPVDHDVWCDRASDVRTACTCSAAASRP